MGHLWHLTCHGGLTPEGSFFVHRSMELWAAVRLRLQIFADA